MLHASDARRMSGQAIDTYLNEDYEHLANAVSKAIENAAKNGDRHEYIPIPPNQVGVDWLVVELRERNCYDVHVIQNVCGTVSAILVSW